MHRFELFISFSRIPTMRPLSSSLKIMYNMVPLKDPLHNMKINRFKHQYNNKGNADAPVQTYNTGFVKSAHKHVHSFLR